MLTVAGGASFTKAQIIHREKRGVKDRMKSQERVIEYPNLKSINVNGILNGGMVLFENELHFVAAFHLSWLNLCFLGLI